MATDLHGTQLHPVRLMQEAHKSALLRSAPDAMGAPVVVIAAGKHGWPICRTGALKFKQPLDVHAAIVVCFLVCAPP
jgi:hypothetical protein